MCYLFSKNHAGHCKDGSMVCFFNAKSISSFLFLVFFFIIWDVGVCGRALFLGFLQSDCIFFFGHRGAGYVSV